MEYTKKAALFILLLAGLSFETFAQFSLDAQIRPRTEFRHGYKTLVPTNTDAAIFTDQRSRLNFNFRNEQIQFKIALQDVRVWGDESQLVLQDGQHTSLHEAWGQIFFNPAFNLKIGRQEIVLDDHRIMGNVGWVQQARSHDAAIFGWSKDQLKLQVAVAYNQDGASLTNRLYTTPGNYKAMQFAWLHNNWGNFDASFLLLNNGVQDIPNNKTLYSQTAGTHLQYKTGALAMTANYYSQFGDHPSGNSLSTSLVGLDATYAISEEIKVFAGYERQSGNDQDATTSVQNAFAPLYGTNHKFNGLMDYFYVGNHANSVGLSDIHAGASYSKGKFTSAAKIFAFASAANVTDGTGAVMSNSLGQEIDLTFTYKINDYSRLNFGYSTMLGSSTMEQLKGGDMNENNSWAWVQININPTLFTDKLE